MTAKESFGRVVRTIGLIGTLWGLFGFIWGILASVSAVFRIPSSTPATQLVFGILYSAMGLIFLKRPDRIVAFAYGKEPV